MPEIRSICLCLAGSSLLLLSVSALAMPTLSRDGPMLEVVAAQGSESILVSNNSALAIDDDGNISQAFNRSAGANHQTLRGIEPDNRMADFEIEAINGFFPDTPTVGSYPANVVAFGFYDLDDNEQPDLSTTLLEFEQVGATSKRPASIDKNDTDFFRTYRQREAARVRLLVTEASNCQPVSVHYVERREESAEAPLIFIDLDFSVGGYYYVHCSDGRNIYVKLNYDERPPTIKRLDISGPPQRQAGAVQPAGLKMTPPNSALPIVATAETASGPIAVYAGQAGDGTPLVTVTDIIDNGTDISIGDSLQLDDYPITNGFGPVLSACGHDLGFEHYWVAFTDNQGQAILARIEESDVDYLEMGSSNGPVDVACDSWGNALMSWWSGDDVLVSAVNANGNEIRRFTETLPTTPFNLVVNAAINANGQAAVSWAVDGLSIQMRRYRMAGHFAIDGTLSGSHFSPRYAGEGFAYDIVEINGQATLVLYYFTYQPDGSGEMNWLVGSAPIIGNRAVVEVASGSGATFGDAFDPDDVQLSADASVIVTFRSCRVVFVDTRSDSLGNHRYLAQRLTGRPLEVDGQCGNGPAGGNQIDASQGGSVFSALRNGEGFFFDVVRVNGPPSLVVYYFTYLPDGSGKPAWLVGSGRIQGNRAEVEVGFGSGGVFGTDFDAGNITITPWGTITVTWVSCSEILIEYDGLWGSGSFTVGPLTGALIGATGNCT